MEKELESKKDKISDKKLNISDVSTRICSYCSGVDFDTMKTQYNDADGDYDDCVITYCIKCRNTHSIEI